MWRRAGEPILEGGERKMDKREKSFSFRVWIESALVLAGLLLLSRLFLQVSVVKGNSMVPTIHDGDRLVVERVTPKLGEIHRFDVVILGNPRNPREDFVKRVVALPGETVAVRKGRLVVNGRILPEFFEKVGEIGDTPTWKVPEDSYFVLGDNRPISLDSREFGFVPKRLIRGKVVLCLWPLSHLGGMME